MRRFCLIMVVLLGLLLTLTVVGLAQKEVTLIIAEGKPDSENAAYNFKEFENETGIKVNMETGPYDSFDQKANMDLMTQQGRYDVFWILSSKIIVWEPYLEDLEPKWNQLPESERNDFFSVTVKNMYAPSGKMIGIPWKFPVPVLFYRKDLFEEAGIEPPQTIEEYRSIERQLTKDTDNDGKTDIYGGGWPGANYWGNSTKLYELAVAFMDPSVQINPWLNKENELTLNAPWNIEALEWVVEAVEEGIYPPETLELQHYDVGRRFMDGALATQNEWPWLWTQAQDPDISKVAGKVGVAVLPKGPGGLQMGVSNAQGFGISKASKNKEEAWELIKWLTSKRALTNTMKYFTWESPRISTWEIPEVDPEVAEVIIETGINLKISAFLYKNGTQIRDLVTTAIQKVLLGEMTPTEALNEAQEEAQVIVKE